MAVPQIEVLPFAALVGVRVDDEAAAGLGRRADVVLVEVETSLAAVDLEQRAGLGGQPVEGLPVEVELRRAGRSCGRRGG